MELDAEIIRGIAFRVHADMKCRIAPATNKTALAWLAMAKLWAYRHRDAATLAYINNLLREAENEAAN